MIKLINEKKVLKVVEASLKGKIIKEMRINIKVNTNDNTVDEIFNMIAPMIYTNNTGDYVNDTYVYYEIVHSKENKILRTFI